MDVSPDVVQLDRVRCLECGATYKKPAEGGMVNQNPGCPLCGYLGWVRATTRPTLIDESRRSGEDPPPPASARSR